MHHPIFKSLVLSDFAAAALSRVFILDQPLLGRLGVNF
jgi:hypothetical protein